jgi:hypothetical protein
MAPKRIKQDQATAIAAKKGGLSRTRLISPAVRSVAGALVAATLAHMLPTLLARLAPFGGGQRAVMIGVGAVEAGERALAHLLARDEALLAEHAVAAHAGAMALGAAGTAGAHMPHAAVTAAGPARAAHRVGLGEFVAADIAVMVGVEPVEHPRPHLAAALLAPGPRFVAREAAVMIGVHPGEPLVDALGDLLTRDVGTRAGAIARLGGGDAGDGEQGGAGQ